MFYPTLSDYEDKTTASFWHGVFMEFSTYFRSLGQKSKNNFDRFLIQMRKRKFASEIY